MKKRNSHKQDERQLADWLDGYVDGTASPEQELPPHLAEISEQLHQASQQPRPRPGFVNELAQQLQRRQETMIQKENERTSWRRLAGLLVKAAGAVALVVVAVYALTIFYRPEPEPAASLEDVDATPSAEPEMITEGKGGMLAGTEVRVMHAPNSEPQEIPLYTFSGSTIPTAEDLLEMAGRLGMEGAEVYREPLNGTVFIAIDTAGNTLSLTGVRGPYHLHYSHRANSAVNSGEPLPYEQAAAVAQAFMEKVGWPTEAYRLEEEREQGMPSAFTLVRVQPLLGGRPVVGTGTGQIAVTPEGEVAHARLILFEATPAGRTLNAVSQEQALQDLLVGAGITGSMMQTAATNAQRSFTPPLPEHRPSDSVTAMGWVLAYQAVDGDGVWAQLSTGRGVSYQLTGDLLAGAEFPASVPVEIQGTIVREVSAGLWEVEVSAWQPASREAMVQCQEGAFVRENDEAFLEVPSGERYRLEAAPEELQGGEAVLVCAETFTDGEAVNWQHIVTPPGVSEPAVVSSGSSMVITEQVQVVEVEAGGGGASGGVVEESVVIEAPPPVRGGEMGTGEGSAMGSTSSPFPYDVGETVVITGMVAGVLRDEGGVLRPDLWLSVDDLGDVTDQPYFVHLTGDEALLREIADHYRLHVTVRGEVIAPDGTIEVASFERTWPEEQLEVFLGHFEEAEMEGRNVLLFVDEETGQQYVDERQLSQDQPAGSLVDPDQRVWVVAVVQPEASYAGLPLLRFHEQRAGSDIDALENAAQLPVELEMPVANMNTSGPSLGTAVIIERIELGYEFRLTQPNFNIDPLQAGEAELNPVWIFYGHSVDNSTSFVIYQTAGNTAE